jgi:uncharacterized repeat protein (TIGR03803 family)
LGQAGLVQATDENFYGLTSFGGANGFGTVFKITSDGTLTTLHSFNGADGGNYMQAPLVQAADGNFYGVGGYPNGSVFEITPSGTDTVLYTFCSKSNCADGDGPNGLLQATDGNFYGTTYSGGNNGSNCPSYGCGTVFKITPQGTLTTLHSFDGTDGHGVEGPAQATNGSFYGTTAFGGTNGDGIVFSLDVGLRPFVETVPTGGPVGTPVTILGNDLSDATHVRFDHTEATFVVVSDTEITAIVPAGATTGFVTVNRRGPRLKSNVQFQVTE